MILKNISLKITLIALKLSDCWAFATTGAVEASLWKNNKTTVTLSPQQLTDCSLTYGNNGCNGGVVAYGNY